MVGEKRVVDVVLMNVLVEDEVVVVNDTLVNVVSVGRMILRVVVVVERILEVVVDTKLKNVALCVVVVKVTSRVNARSVRVIVSVVKENTELVLIRLIVARIDSVTVVAVKVI